MRILLEIYQKLISINIKTILGTLKIPKKRFLNFVTCKTPRTHYRLIYQQR